ncbi:MAG TPA: DUF3617 family protein [Usitatibacter sp.]|nr:DUF3617 family protein [Usitatibacter sp.]
MKNARLFALALVAGSAALALAAGPEDYFKGRMKAGMYEYKMTMNMGAVPGMPPGMGMRDVTFSHCVTDKDIENGRMGRGGRDGKMPETCKITNFTTSGNSASYTMTCTDPQMTADNKVTFGGDAFHMDMKMSMVQNGHPMNMEQHMDAKYLGACPPAK